MGQSCIKARLHIYNLLNINHSPSLGVGLDPAAPRHLSEEFGKQVGPFWTLWLNRRVSLINLNWSFPFACDRLQRNPLLWAWSTSSFSSPGARRAVSLIWILSNWMMTLGGTIRETTDSSNRQAGFQVHRIPFRNEFQKLFITKSIFQSPKNQDIWTRQQYIFTVLAFKGNTSLCWRGKTWVPNMQREVTWWHSDTLTRHFPFWASLSITACQISASKPALKM